MSKLLSCLLLAESYVLCRATSNQASSVSPSPAWPPLGARGGVPSQLGSQPCSGCRTSCQALMRSRTGPGHISVTWRASQHWLLSVSHTSVFLLSLNLTKEPFLKKFSKDSRLEDWADVRLCIKNNGGKCFDTCASMFYTLRDCSNFIQLILNTVLMETPVTFSNPFWSFTKRTNFIQCQFNGSRVLKSKKNNRRKADAACVVSSKLLEDTVIQFDSTLWCVFTQNIHHSLLNWSGFM